MKYSRKTWILLAAIFASAVCFFVVLHHFQKSRLSRKIPDIPDMVSIILPLRNQITEADKKARRYPSADNIGQLGLVYNSSAYYPEAALCYKLAIEIDKRNWTWNYYLGYLNVELGNAEETIRCFSEVTRNNIAPYMAYYYIGGAYQSLNKNDSAMKYYSRIADLNDSLFFSKRSVRQSSYPLPVYVRFEMSRIYMNSGQNEMAEKTLNELTQNYPSFGPAYRQLGVLFVQKGDSVISRNYFSRANDLATYFPPADTMIDKIAFISRAEAYLMKQIELAIRTSNSNLAFALLKQGLKYMPDNKYFLSSIIRGYLMLGMGDLSLGFLDKHLDYFSTDMKEMKEVGQQLILSGLKEQAIKYLLKASEIKTGNPASFSEIAIWLNDLGERERALNLIDSLIAENPNNTRVISDAVFLFLFSKEHERGLKYLEKLRQMPDSYSNVRIFDGMIADHNGKTDEALRQYELSINASPKNMKLINTILRICYQKKNWEKTAITLYKAIDTFPNDPELQLKLGELLITCNDKRIINTVKGIEYSERAYLNYSSSIPVRVAAAKNLAIAFMTRGNFKKAQFYIGWAIDIAKKVNAPANLLKELDGISKEVSLPR